MATAPIAATQVVTDVFPINGTDYVEFYVGNARQAAHYYQTAFGFQLVGYRGPETGVRDRATYLLQQDRIRLLLTAPLRPSGDIAGHVYRHGDGVRDLAFWVEDAREAFRLAVERGAAPVRQPEALKDAHGEVVVAAVGTYGDTIHSLVERRNYHGPFMPGFVELKPRYQPDPVGLRYVDHCVGNVELGAMDRWVSFYEKVMGFKNLLSFDDKDISTEYSALMSKVMANGNERIKLPINEPAAGRRKSQVDEYLEFYLGPGVQHIAMATANIIETVSALRDRGVEFLKVPASYYDTLPDRVGHIDEEMAAVRELNLLVDRDEQGYLLQIFTRPVEDRPTLFYEIIQRKGARSFGKGNFKALFEAIEREQAARGNL